MARWVRLQLGSGTFEGRRIVSAENLAVTRTPKVANQRPGRSYALGWVIHQTPNGNIVWHNGDAVSFGSLSAWCRTESRCRHSDQRKNVGLPDAIGRWVLDRILGNPKIDYVADKFKEEAKTAFERKAKRVRQPANPRPFPPLASLAGNFVNPSLGEATVAPDGDALVMELHATGAKLKLEPWDGDIFIAKLMPTGQFAPIVDLDYMISGFVQAQMDKDGKLNLLRLSSDDGQPYEFRRR